MATAPRLIDLHTHTTASDGSDTPAEVVRKAADLGLIAVAITDHDTVAGLDEGEEESKRHSIEFIRGCELSANCDYGSVHILGLWLPKEHAIYAEKFTALQTCRNTRNRKIIEKLQSLGINISYEEVIAVSGGEAIGRPHIANVLIQHGEVATSREAFDRYLARGKAAYVAREGLSPQDAVKLLASIGATVSIAHPMLISCTDAELNDIVADMRAVGLHAIEAYHSSHSESDVRHCVDLARRHGLVLSGGSDYHGTHKPYIALGRGRGGLRVAWHVLEALKEQRRALGLPLD